MLYPLFTKQERANHLWVLVEWHLKHVSLDEFKFFIGDNIRLDPWFCRVSCCFAFSPSVPYFSKFSYKGSWSSIISSCCKEFHQEKKTLKGKSAGHACGHHLFGACFTNSN